jgi:signal peptidase
MRPRRDTRSVRPLRIAAGVLVVGLAAAWFVLVRPQSLGGSAEYVIVSGRSMEPTLQDTDLVVARRQATYRHGDVVVYHVPHGDPGEGALVIHRIVGGSAARGYLTRGDNREGNDQWRPTDTDVVGRVQLTVPHGGRVLGFLLSELGVALLAGLVAFAVALAPPGSRHRPRTA